MSSAGITFGGLASGLDTKSIIAALVAVEQQPITLLENKKTLLTKSKSMMGERGAEGRPAETAPEPSRAERPAA